MRIVGADPGLSGGLVLLEDGQPTFMTAMPVIQVPKANKGKKREYLEADIVRFLKAANPEHVVIEAQHAMPLQGLTSTFSTGLGYGIIRGVCAGLQLPFSTVQSVVWQRAVLGRTTGGDKSVVLLFCNRRWPKVRWLASERSRIAHDGMCDAVCLAAWGELTLQTTFKNKMVGAEDTIG